MAGRHVAGWRFPAKRQAAAEDTLRRMRQVGPTPDVASQAAPATPAGPGDPVPGAYWQSVLAEPVTRTRPPGVPIQNRRLSDIPRHVLRVGCRRCDRTIEIQTTDAQKLYGQHAVWKDVGRKLLADGCQQCTGSHEDDGCWPSYDAR